MISNHQVASIFTLIVFGILFSYGDAVVCYQCNSAFDPRCGDPFDPYSLGTVNCSFQPHPEHLSHLEPRVCRKISQKTNGKTRVVRGCGYLTDENRDNKECARRTGTHEVIVHYCSCTEDLCNGANSKIPALGFFGIFGIILSWTIN